MSEPEHEEEAEVPGVTEVPEPDQPTTEERDEEESHEVEEEEAQTEPEPEASATTPEEWEARFTYADRTFATYAKKVEAKWEEDAVNLVRFNLDPAAPPGYLDMRNKGHVEDDTKAAALAFLGFDAEEGMQPDPYSQLCKTCDGWGEVVTGSKVVNHGTRICKDCQGVGYVAEGEPAPTLTGNGFDADSVEQGQLVPNATGPESPELEAYRRKGYTIIPPMQTST